MPVLLRDLDDTLIGLAGFLDDQGLGEQIEWATICRGDKVRRLAYLRSVALDHGVPVKVVAHFDR